MPPPTAARISNKLMDPIIAIIPPDVVNSLNAHPTTMPAITIIITKIIPPINPITAPWVIPSHKSLLTI